MGPRGREMGPLRGLLRDSPSPLSEFIAALDSSDYCPANHRPRGPGLSNEWITLYCSFIVSLGGTG